jgi:hypothetical protein
VKPELSLQKRQAGLQGVYYRNCFAGPLSRDHQQNVVSARHNHEIHEL